MILQRGSGLYRYSLGNEMPNHWSKEYHSPEYHTEKYGDKNQVGAFFFYLDEQTARNVLGVAVQKAIERGEKYERNTITECYATSEIRLLDLTGCARPVNMLNILYDEGIDVLNSSFVKYDDSAQGFDSLKPYHQFIMDNEGSNDRIVRADMKDYAAQIDQFFHWRVGYTGQLLTDFENGVAFKRLLVEKGFEGYQFMEEKDSPTICLFEADKISAPVHTLV